MSTLPGAKWSCRGCGKCCEGFAFGPVEPRVIDGLHAADIEGSWAPAAEAPWHEARDGAHYLTHRDGHCVFLRPDKLCAVHALLGEAAKPWFCREYPLLAVETPSGVVVDVRPDCGGVHESFLDGAPLADQVDALLALPRPVPRQTFNPDTVVVAPGMGIDAAQWEAVWSALSGHLRDPRDPAATVAVYRRLIAKMASRPDPTPDPATSWQATTRILDLLIETDLPCADTLASARAQGDSLPALDDTGRAYLHRVLLGDLHVRRFGQLGASVPAGLGLSLLESRIARLASQGSSAAQLGPTLSTLRRSLLLPQAWAAIRRAHPALEALAWTA